MGQKQEAKKTKPDIFEYHDIREFLHDWLEHLGSKSPGFNVDKLSELSGVSRSHLYQALKGQQKLSKKILSRVMPILGLAKEAQKYLELLRDLNESEKQEERVSAYMKISKTRRYKGLHKDSFNQHKYLSEWYFPAVRELARYPDFNEDPNWVRKQLGYRISISEARGALRFLFDENYLRYDENGKVELTHPDNIQCDGGVYRLAMSQYHEQTLNIAKQSIIEVPREFRDLNVHTTAFAKKDVPKIKAILAKAIQEIQGLEQTEEENDSVYQVSLLAFPLTAEGEK